MRAVGSYADVIVLRHPDINSSIEAAYHLDKLADKLGQQCLLVSGGAGIGEHPTQALLDLYTIVDFKGGIDHLKITMVGDLRNGRTVHSLSKLIARYGAQGTSLAFVSPPSLKMPQDILDFLTAHKIQVTQTDHLDDVLDDTDVIYWTRIQEERFESRADYEAIADHFIMTPLVLNRAKHDAILMHPLPRKHEMGSTDDHAILDDDPRSVYFHQMQNGMFVRMALLANILGELL